MTFSEFMSNRVTTNAANYFQVNCTNFSDLGLLLSTGIINCKALHFGHNLGLKS